LVKLAREGSYIEWPERESNPRHADFQFFETKDRGPGQTVQVLLLRHLRHGVLSPLVCISLAFGHRFGHRCLPQTPLNSRRPRPWNRPGHEGASLCRWKMRVGVPRSKNKILAWGECRPRLACGWPGPGGTMVDRGHAAAAELALDRSCRASTEAERLPTARSRWARTSCWNSMVLTPCFALLRSLRCRWPKLGKAPHQVG
jgi:hypothetical protein